MDSHKNSGRENRLRLRGRIVKVASEMFVTNGIKNTRMDDIAIALSISKRTLYEIFKDKEDLLLEIMRVHYVQMKEFSETVSAREGNVLEKLFVVLQHNLNDMRKVSKGFIQELQRYPHVIEFMRDTQKHRAELAQHFYEAGLKEELFLPRINYDIVIALHEYMQGFIDFVLQRDLDLAEIIQTTIFVHLRGISTEKGKRMLEEFYSRIKSENQKI